MDATYENLALIVGLALVLGGILGRGRQVLSALLQMLTMKASPEGSGGGAETMWQRAALVVTGLAVVASPHLVPSQGEPGDVARAPTSTTSVAGAPCPPLAPGSLQIGDYYLREPGDLVSTQVVDGSATGDPLALWVTDAGIPVMNPAIPLPADIVDVVSAFGSVEAVVDYNRCHLRPRDDVLADG